MTKENIRYRRLGLDAAELYEKYKDTVWISNIELERLSICALPVFDFIRGKSTIRRGYYESQSVPLPGTPHLDVDEEMQNITYTPAKWLDNVDPKAIYDVTARWS